MTGAGPTASCHAVTSMHLHLDLQEIQQLELGFMTWSIYGRLQQGPAVLADGCLSRRTTADYLCTRCTVTHEYLRAKHTVTCAACVTCTLWTAGYFAIDKY
jgi:hypothetical protein